jgi:hypothetical protein
MKKKIKSLIVMAAILYMTYSFSITVYAEEGYTYNYDYWGDIQYSPDAYDVVGVYTSVELGMDVSFNAPSGMFVQDKKMYVCDTGNNRIVEIERKSTGEFEVIRIIENFVGDTDVRTLAGPTDISVTEDGYMYICDKGNNRILKLDMDLNYIMEFLKPSDATFDQSQSFLPDKLVVDSAGRVYCIADNINKGLIKYEADGVFTGFLGASEVTYDWTDYVWKKLATKEQRAALESFVPTEYDNIYMDGEGFIYACTTNVSKSGLNDGSDEPIRKLNMMGKNILIENGNWWVIGDIYWGEAGGYSGPSLMTDITALDNGVYFGLDKVRGRMFAYDSQGNLLYAYGGNGNLDGCFKIPSAIEQFGNDIVVLDSQDCSFTVFTSTEYGSLIYKAIDEYNAGDYTASGETWQQVLKINGNYDLAYIGVGRALLRQGKYEQAMEYFKLKWDDDNYSKAFKQYRKEWVENHIQVILGAVILLLLIPLTIRKAKLLKHEIDIADLFNAKN